MPTDTFGFNFSVLRLGFLFSLVKGRSSTLKLENLYDIKLSLSSIYDELN